MYKLKGFISIPSLADNAVGEIASLGEISALARTYAREKGEYIHETHTDVKLVSFLSKDFSEEQLITAPQSFSEHTLEIAQWVMDQSTGAFQDSPSEWADGLLSAFDNVESVDLGPIVHVTDDGSGTERWMPAWVQWHKSDEDPLEGYEENEIRIWFSDENFKNHYDEYEVVVIPPVDEQDLDKLITEDSTTVEGLLSQRDAADLSDLINQERDQYPYTFLITNRYNWVSTSNSTIQHTSFWTVLIYGAAGNTLDNIRRAYIDYILDVSQYNEAEWTDVLPSLFRTNEFVMIPLWDHYSVPNQTLESGKYSPSVRVKDVISIAEQYAVGYTTGHLEENVVVSATLHRSAAFLAVGSDENLNGETRFDEKFDDYFIASTSSNEFNKMSKSTQDWVLMFYEMLDLAETMDETSSLPVGYSRLWRDNVMYLVGSYDNFQYIVAAKHNFVE